MRKISWTISAFVVLFIVGAIIISAQPTGNGETLGSTVSGYIQDFVHGKGISSDNITGINEVDFNALPKEVNIKNVNDNNLAIYQVNYSDGENQNSKSIYVITYSVDKLQSQGDLIVSQDKRNFLDFGYEGVMNQSGFLDTSAGVETSSSKGYVMVRDGSITAISTNLEVIQANPGQIDIEVLKNGQPISFGNTFSTDNIGIKKDYDVQASGNVEFHAGDVISVLVKGQGNISWRDVITLVEITTTD